MGLISQLNILRISSVEPSREKSDRLKIQYNTPTKPVY